MSGQTNGGVFNPKNLGLFSYTYNNPINLVDPDGEAVDPRLKITGATAMYDSDVTHHNYSIEETDAAFETMGMVLGGAGLIRHFGKKYGPKMIGDGARSLGVKTTMGLGKEGLQKFYAKNLLKNGTISAKDFNSLIPKGTKGTWKPTKDIKLGKKYNFKVNNTNMEFKIHSPDKNAKIKFPGSNSGSQWTAQIKVGKKYLGADGNFYKNNKQNITHIPFRMK
jgi:hypothetical protein